MLQYTHSNHFYYKNGLNNKEFFFLQYQTMMNRKDVFGLIYGMDDIAEYNICLSLASVQTKSIIIIRDFFNSDLNRSRQISLGNKVRATLS